MRSIIAKVAVWLRGEWAALRLLLATIAIPLATAVIWYGREPLSGWCRLHLIAYNLSRGDLDAAAKNASSLLALAPATITAAVQRACHWPVEQRRWLAEAILPLPDEPMLRRSRASAEADTARRLEWVLLLDPDQREALVMSAESHYRSGHYRRAALALERALALAAAESGSYWEYYHLGQTMLALDRYDEAEKYFSAAARMIPRLPDPWYGLIDALERQAKYREAIAAVNRILLLERAADFENRMQALLRRARLFGWLGRKDLALRDIDAAMAFWPGKGDDAQTLLIKARALVASDLVAEAMPLLDRLIAADPGCAEYHLLRAQACQDAGLTAEAAAAYRQAMACGAQTSTILNNFAWTLLMANEPEQRDPVLALSLARRAVALDAGKNAYSLDTLAEACYQNHLFAEAVLHETRAVERGGEVYRPSLERYRQAAAAAKAGQEVKIEVSQLKEHHKPPRGDGGTTLDPSAMPAPPRFPPAGYQQAAGSVSATDERVAAMAEIWRKFPPSAVDDPRVDLRIILGIAVAQGLSTDSRAIHQSEYRFLAGMHRAVAKSSPPWQREGDPDILSTSFLAPRAEGSEAILGERAGRYLLSLSAAEAAAVLKCLAEKRMFASEWFIADYYPDTMAAQGEQTSVDGDDEAEAAERIWQEASKRLRAAAAGENLTAPAKRWQPPRHFRPEPLPPRGSPFFVPTAPPKDDEEEEVENEEEPPDADDGEETDLTPQVDEIE